MTNIGALFRLSQNPYSHTTGLSFLYVYNMFLTLFCFMLVCLKCVCKLFVFRLYSFYLTYLKYFSKSETLIARSLITLSVFNQFAKFLLHMRDNKKKFISGNFRGKKRRRSCRKWRRKFGYSSEINFMRVNFHISGFLHLCWDQICDLLRQNFIFCRNIEVSMLLSYHIFQIL